jgi:ferredoxin
LASYRIKFLPSEIVYPAEDGENILELAMKAGIHINASCGGNGSCGKCRIRLIKGEITASHTSYLRIGLQ